MGLPRAGHAEALELVLVGQCRLAGTVPLASGLVDQKPRFQDFVIAHELTCACSRTGGSSRRS